MAEGLLNFTRHDDPDELVHTTQGRPLSPGDELLVVDRDGVPVEPGQVGELWTRGPYTIRGYYRAPEADGRSFSPQGHYRTGDLVRQLPTGHLVVEGRIKDVINRGGENVPTGELEEALAAHPAVAQVAVVGIPHHTLGEAVCAVIIVAPATGGRPTLAELRAHLVGLGLGQFMLPDRLEIADQLPVTAVGKVDKQKVAAAVLEPDLIPDQRRNP
jgi:mycobactin salicyl-AMP ligase